MQWTLPVGALARRWVQLIITWCSLRPCMSDVAWSIYAGGESQALTATCHWAHLWWHISWHQPYRQTKISSLRRSDSCLAWFGRESSCYCKHFSCPNNPFSSLGNLSSRSHSSTSGTPGIRGLFETDTAWLGKSMGERSGANHLRQWSWGWQCWRAGFWGDLNRT